MLQEIVTTVSLDVNSCAGALPGLLWPWQPEGRCISSLPLVLLLSSPGSFTVLFSFSCHKDVPFLAWYQNPLGPQKQKGGPCMEME